VYILIGELCSRVKIRSVSPNPKKIATKHFFALTALMGHGESPKKSLGSSDPGNRVNLHIFKMAAIDKDDQQSQWEMPNFAVC